MLATARYILSRAADTVFPPRCYRCLEEDTWLCQDCAKNIPVHFLSCIICAKPSARGLTCLQCRSKTALHGVVTAAAYQAPDVSRAIGWLKFKGVRAVAPLLSQRLTPYLLSIAPLDTLQTSAVFVPIPLHRNRERARGFNQSADLAQAAARHTHIPAAELLTRTKATLTQKELPASFRAQNTKDAFTLKEALPKKSIFLLIDDVTTTGSTLSSAAQVLQAAGAKEIWGVTIGHG
jgi:ComF family protein